MKCLICGKEIEKGIICKNCESKVTEDLCYQVAGCNTYEPENELWKDIIEGLESKFSFKDYSLELADYLDDRKTLIKLRCMKIMYSNYPGVSKKHRDYVLEKAESCINNENLSDSEKNFVNSLLLGVYVANYDWKKANAICSLISLDSDFFEPYNVLSDYYKKIREYDKALDILEDAKTKFQDLNEQAMISERYKDISSRKNGEAKHWKPAKADEIKLFYEYLDSLGIEHDMPGNIKKKKVLEADFKAFHRYEKDTIPEEYVVFWITSEYFLKVDEPVEINAVKVQNGVITDKYHRFNKPINKPKSLKHVKEDDIMNAHPISEVFPDFLKFANGWVFVSLGFDEQKKMLSRMARYSMMDEIPNEIFDVIEFYEENSDDFELYTAESLLKKFKIKNGSNGAEKVEATYKLLEKMR